MKSIISIAAIAIAVAGPVQAAGFQPWAAERTAVRADSTQDQIQPGSFYREGTPRIVDQPSPAPAEVIVKPWYAGDRA